MHIHIYTYMHTYVRVCIHKYRHERKQCHARMDRWMKGCVLVNIHIQIDVYCIHTHITMTGITLNSLLGPPQQLPSPWHPTAAQRTETGREI